MFEADEEEDRGSGRGGGAERGRVPAVRRGDPRVWEWAEDAGNRKHALYFGAYGSYDEFVDCVLGPPEVLVLCHDCGHALMAEWFPRVDVTGWHTHG